MNGTIGSRIAAYRKEKGMTQEELAGQLGVSAQAVSKWENDVSCPDIALIPKLCRTLGVSSDDILIGREERVRMLPEEHKKPLEELTLRIYVNSADGDKVRVNLPMTLVKVCLEVGVDVVPNMKGNAAAVSSLDLGKIMDLAQRGVIGKLVEVESSDGDIVEVVVE